VWRHPEENLDVLRTAALATTTDDGEQIEPQAVAELGEDAWVVDRGKALRFVIVDQVNEMFTVLDCGTDKCKNQSAAVSLATKVAQKLPAASDNQRRMGELLGKVDMGDWAESPVPKLDRYPWDRVSLDGSIRGGDHAISLELARKPAEGSDARIEAWKKKLTRPEPLEGVGDGGFVSATPQKVEHLFYVAETETVVRLSCAAGLCPTRKVADDIAQRVAEKALDPDNFVDPDAKRPRPFVPRGHVKGRAERIWYPFKRFWLKIR
jgi:hypothetical protein